RFGGNLFYTRLRGHGRRPESMAEVTLDDWYQDVEDAVSVGAEAGKSVVLIGCSTGAALSLWYASQSRNPRICALVLLSPNYSTRNLIARYLDTPLGYLLTRIFPVHRPGRDLQSPLVRRFWYRSYPTRALIPMIQLLKRVRSIRKKSVGIPALTVYSEHDRVVSPKAVRKMKNRFAGPSETVVFNRTGSGNCHILAGDILSPQTTGEVARLICAFLQNYLR
ncbi:MAG: alpha/beta hydrolase, partial [Fibrobacterota bacterium]